MNMKFEAIGTQWNIDIHDTIHQTLKDTIARAIQARIREFDVTYSRFKADSWLTKLSLQAKTYDLPHDAYALFALYRHVYEVTEGLVTPLIGQVLVDAGYDRSYSFIQKRQLTQPPRWDDVIELTSSTITMKKPALLDLGAIGKGYLVDIVGKVIETHGVISYSIDAGGDILNRGNHPITVGLEHPMDTTKVIGRITLNNQSIAGSAGNRRRWGKFHHIINPSTLTSPEHIAGVWVVAETAMLADAMATALYFASAEKVRDSFTFDYLIIRPDASVEGTLVGHPMVELF